MDIIGRRFILSIGFIVGGIILVLFPIAAPSEGLYIACGVVFFLFTSLVEDNPLIMDYVIKEDRGKAFSSTIMGLSVGVLLSFNVLYEFTRNLDPMISWSILGGIYFMTGVMGLTFIKEPVDIDKKEGTLCF